MTDCLQHTDRITLQLSNLCNYAREHERCPAHHQTVKQVLPSTIVQDVIDTLATMGYDREDRRIAWHIYNEPLMDPRLSEFVRYAHKCLPHTCIIVWTNGYYLTDVLFAELFRVGASHWRMTAYNAGEMQRLGQLIESGPCPKSCVLIKGALDNRMHRHGSGHGLCHAPLRDLCVYPTGQIGLCCLDWQQTASFADLNKQSFADALETAYPEMLRVYNELGRKVHSLPVCKNCGGGR